MFVKRNPPEKKKKKKPIVQQIILDNKVRIPFPYVLEKEIQDKFSFLNPEYLQLCKRRGLSADKRPPGFIMTKEKIDGRWTSRRIEAYLFYWEFDGNDLVVPRGAFQTVRKLFIRHGRPYKVTNKRYLLESTNFKFHGELMKEKGQLPFVNYSFKNGILQSGTGTGKTTMFLYWVAKIQQPAVIVVDTKELLNQWISRITTFYRIKKNQIGIIGSGKEIIKPITVALVQTLKNKPDLLEHFSCCGVDECQIAATESYGMVLNNFHGVFTMGLSATPRRKDGKTRVMFWYLSRIRMKLSKKKIKKLPATVWFINTPYEGEVDFRKSYSIALRTMLEDKERNQYIVDNILKWINFYGIHLIISNSSKHLERLIDLLPHHFKLISHLLVGKVKDKEREEIVAKAMRNELKFLFATDKLIGKAFDEELLSVLHQVSPTKDPEQLCGRVTRIPMNKEVRKLKKKALIFYYFDSKETVLRGAASQSSKIFGKLKIQKRILPVIEKGE